MTAISEAAGVHQALVTTLRGLNPEDRARELETHLGFNRVTPRTAILYQEWFEHPDPAAHAARP
jgi:hypothetical protein